jgi:catechol 2,3-dioxygenase-like lactoylglutathione lyase family enzyme
MTEDDSGLDSVHHVAIAAEDVVAAVRWYRGRFRCEVRYQDETWALLAFANVQLAVVRPDQHPPHVGFVHPRAAEFGSLIHHRDGTRSVYVDDSAGNSVELLAPDGLDAPDA